MSQYNSFGLVELVARIKTTSPYGIGIDERATARKGGDYHSRCFCRRRHALQAHGNGFEAQIDTRRREDAQVLLRVGVCHAVGSTDYHGRSAGPTSRYRY